MIRKFFLVVSLSLCSIGASAQNTFDYSDSVFEVGHTKIVHGITFNMNNQDVIVDETTQPSLDSLRDFLKSNRNVNFEIGVHTDTRGKEWANMKMSEFRAKSLRLYLIREGISEDVLVARPYGESEPVHSSAEIDQFRDSDKEKMRQLHNANRRIVLKVLSFETKAQKTFNFSDSVFEIGQTKTFQDIRFELNKPYLLLDSVCQPFLDSIVQFCLGHSDILIEVGVHTDLNLKYRSSNLTGARAENLRTYLVEQGVDVSKVVSRGYGDTCPIHHPQFIEQFKTKDKEKYHQLHRENRRVVLKIVSV